LAGEEGGVAAERIERSFFLALSKKGNRFQKKKEGVVFFFPDLAFYMLSPKINRPTHGSDPALLEP